MIKFSDLSWPLKVAVVGGWVTVIVYSLSLTIGFIEGIMSI